MLQISSGELLMEEILKDVVFKITAFLCELLGNMTRGFL